MKQIELTQGKVALVDDSDFEWLNQWKWCAAIFLVIGFVTLFMGCSNHTAKETLRVEDGVVYYRSELAQWSLLSFSEAVDVEHVTPLSSTCIGSVTAVPDANSIDSTGGVLGEIIKVILTK